MANRSGQNVLEAEKLRSRYLINCEYEVIGCLLFAAVDAINQSLEGLKRPSTEAHHLAANGAIPRICLLPHLHLLLTEVSWSLTSLFSTNTAISETMLLTETVKTGKVNRPETSSCRQ